MLDGSGVRFLNSVSDIVEFECTIGSTSCEAGKRLAEGIGCFVRSGEGFIEGHVLPLKPLHYIDCVSYCVAHNAERSSNYVCSIGDCSDNSCEALSHLFDERQIVFKEFEELLDDGHE